MPYPVPPELPPLYSSPHPEASRCPKLSLLRSEIASAEVLSPAIRKTIPPGIAPPESSRSYLKTATQQNDSSMEIAASTILPLPSKLPLQPIECLTSSGIAKPLPVAKPLSITVKSIAKPETSQPNRSPKLSAIAVPKPIVPARGAIPVKKQVKKQAVVSKAASKVLPKKIVPLPSAPAKTPTKTPAKTATPQPDVSYSISGVSGKLPQTAEAAVMKKLDHAFVFDQLIEVYDAIGALTARDLRRLAKRSPRQIIPLITAQAPNTSTSPQSPTEILIPPSNSPSGTPPADIPANVPTVPIVPSENPASENPASENPANLNSVPPVNPLPAAQVPGARPQPIVNEPVTSPTVNPVEVTADRLDYDERNQVFTAEGNVIMRFRNGLVNADRVQVNLTNRIAVAEGDVAFTRGRQVLRGQRAELNFVQGVGNIQQARGDIFIPTAGTDLAIPAANDGVAETVLGRPASDRITSQQPLQNPGGA